MEERQRQTIADLFRAGQTPKVIFKVTGYPPTTVYRTVTKPEAEAMPPEPSTSVATM